MSSRTSLRTLSPMLASVGDRIPGAGWAYEPKYDGIRVLAIVTGTRIQLVTRNHKDKAFQFPEIVGALRLMADRLGTTFVLDGEIVALRDGTPARFQQLQSRIHVRDFDEIEQSGAHSPTAFIVFDFLVEGPTQLMSQPWIQRRARLERLFRRRWSKQVRAFVWLSEVMQDLDDTSHQNPREDSPSPGGTLLQHAQESGWEGIIAKQREAPYTPGVRTPWWRKLKIEFRQEFVIGGYTEPRRTRPYFGALLLGYYADDTFVYAGHTGSGFDVPMLKELYHRLLPLEQARSPFHPAPRANERPHWVRPEIVVEVKFTQWTDDGRLRHPIFLGIREDLSPRAVKREAHSMQYEPTSSASIPMASSSRSSKQRTAAPAKTSSKKTPVVSSRSRPSSASTSSGTSRGVSAPRALTSVIRQIDQAEKAGEGIIAVRRGHVLAVTNVNKVLFPKSGHTKGDLMRYYTRVAPLILPTIAARPLVLKRFPDGITADGFYQHKAGSVPSGVRTATVHIGGSDREQIIGGDLLTLLYTIQLGSISVDPLHAHVPHIEYADYAILDLDPGKRAPFTTVIAVARYVKESLDALGLHGALKTSGATGLHVYLPLPNRTTNESAQLLAELVATHVASAHPTEATVERAVKRRKTTTVYVDYLQNILGKTVAGPYSVRALPNAPVSTPLAWDELTDTLDPSAFTIDTVLDRFAQFGDVWAEQMRQRNQLKGMA